MLEAPVVLLAVLLVVGWSVATFAQPAPLALVDAHAIDRYVTAEMRRQGLPGVEIGIYRQGHAIFEKGYGLANVELNVPVRTQTLMQSGSVGKQFTATAIMILVDQGKLALKDSVTRFFTDAPDSWKPILVENLLSHTSGLAEYESDARTAPGGEFDLRMDFSDAELLAKIEKLPLEFAPGAKWEYSNTNYVLLGLLIHRVSGMPWNEFLKQYVLEPIGMHETRVISDRSIVMNRAAGYELEDGELRNQSFVSHTFNSTADGTLYFDVVDLEQWDRALYGTQLLNADALKLMWTPFLLSDGKPNAAGYGFGWQVSSVNGHRVIEHGGAWQGFTCHIARYVDDGLSVVVLTNLDSDHAAPENIERVVAGIINPALLPKIREPIVDAQPSIASSVKGMLQSTLRGENAGSFFAAEAGYRFSATSAAGLSAALPSVWDKAPLVLLQRHPEQGLVASTFRVGVPGDTRSIKVTTDTTGKITRYHIAADPDNR